MLRVSDLPTVTHPGYGSKYIQKAQTQNYSVLSSEQLGAHAWL